MKPLSQSHINKVAETFNAAITSEGAVTDINGNAWNKLVNIRLTNQFDTAYKINRRPKGLLKLVQSSRDDVLPGVFSDTDYLINKQFTLKATIKFSVKEVIDELKRMLGTDSITLPNGVNLFEQFVNGAFANPNDTNTPNTYARVLNDFTTRAILDLTQKTYNTLAKISCDALNGSFTLTGDNGLSDVFTTSIISSTSSNLWTTPASSDPLADAQVIHGGLKAHVDNDGNGLRNWGSTLMCHDLFALMLKSTSLKDALANKFLNQNLSPTYIDPQGFNDVIGQTSDFGRLIYVDEDTNYADSSGTIQPLLNQDYMYGASGTERNLLGGIPSAPIVLGIVPISNIDKLGHNPGTVSFSQSPSGFTVIQKDYWDNTQQEVWEYSIAGILVPSQLKPIARRKVR